LGSFIHVTQQGIHHQDEEEWTFLFSGFEGFVSRWNLCAQVIQNIVLKEVIG
jgi:hypothetical protein